MENIFVEIYGLAISGFLVDYSLSGRCEIWFPYALETMQLLVPGRFLVVKDFKSLEPGMHGNKEYAILQMISKKVTHFSIEEIRKMARPTRVQEELEIIREDWNRFLEQPENDKLLIRVDAEKTESCVKHDNKSLPQIGRLEHEPIQGENVYLLAPEYVNEFINGDLLEESSDGVVIASHKIYSSLPVCINYNKLVTRHFGIFGFTGSGKSNLVSTLLAKVAQYEAAQQRGGLNLLLFDVNNEYITLFLDRLFESKNAFVVFLDDSSIGRYLQQFLQSGNPSYLDKAAKDLVNNTTAPDGIKETELYNKCSEVARYLLLQNKVRLLSPYFDFTIRDAIVLIRNKVEDLSVPGIGTQKKEKIREIVEAIFARGEYHLWQYPVSIMLEDYLRSLSDAITSQTDNGIKEGLVILHKEISNLYKIVQKHCAYRFGIGEKELLQICHDEQSSLVIFNGSTENVLREFSGNFVERIYQHRKNKGITSPNVLFFYDEADLFMPGSSDVSGTKEEKQIIQSSSAACETLARRGRKFGLGLGFATQRTTRLNTNIMGQIGTYFVGRLPRQVDRDTILNSFGSVDGEVFQQTTAFSSGNWLLMSHTAMARKSPIAIKTENADERILNFVKYDFPAWEEQMQTRIAQIEKMQIEFNSGFEMPQPQDISATDVERYMPVYNVLIHTEAHSAREEQPTSSMPDKEKEISPLTPNPLSIQENTDTADPQQTEHALGNAQLVPESPSLTTSNKKQKEHWQYLEHLIESGEFTREELIQLVYEKFPDIKESTIRTKVIDCISSKYNSLSRLARKTADGKITF